MKICAYVNDASAKANYKNECYNVRMNTGHAVVIDILRRAGYEVDYAGPATVHNYDIVLVTITADCDWWQFLRERHRWRKGNYKVIVGGPGVLNIRPIIPYADYFTLGRAEGVVLELIEGRYSGNSVIDSKTFDVNKDYYINQVTETYPHEVRLENNHIFLEEQIGCNHRCLFCGYTWHRIKTGDDVFLLNNRTSNNKLEERAMMDIHKGIPINLQKLRTTAIDGLSERLRFAVNKRLTREMVQEFYKKKTMVERPGQLKLYNVCGYPTEDMDDWYEFLEDIQIADSQLPKRHRQQSILLHNTPFRPMPATPLACEPASYKNYRGLAARELGRGLKGKLIYQGNAIWAVESMGVESLPTHIQSMIMHRGTEDDADNVLRIALSEKYRKADISTKIKILEKYFDVDKYFRRYSPEEYPTRYLKTYASVEKQWGIEHFKK